MAKAPLYTRLYDHAAADFDPDWAEKAAKLMEEAAAIVSKVEDRKNTKYPTFSNSSKPDGKGDWIGGWYYTIEGQEVGPFETYLQADDDAYAKHPELTRHPRVFIGTSAEDWPSCGNVVGDIHCDDEGDGGLLSVCIETPNQKWLDIDERSALRLVDRMKKFGDDRKPVAWLGMEKTPIPGVEKMSFKTILVFPDHPRSEDMVWTPLYEMGG
jgi:hypothetical protein